MSRISGLFTLIIVTKQQQGLILHKLVKRRRYMVTMDFYQSAQVYNSQKFQNLIN